MSFLEWFLEPANPGPVGKVEVNEPEPEDEDEELPREWPRWFATVVGLLLMGFGLYWVFHNLSEVGVNV